MIEIDGKSKAGSVQPSILVTKRDVAFSPDQADDCGRLVDALVAAGATRV